MTHSTTPESTITKMPVWNLPQTDTGKHACSLTAATDHTSSAQESIRCQVPPCAKPFDQWRPLGGGAGHDIFRRFKILGAEEENFLADWAKRSPGKGILSRDETGTLVFRINPTNIPDLAYMRIGRPDAPALETRWLHVYDQDGISWLTQISFTGRNLSSAQTYDTADQPMLAGGNLGRFGPSGLTVEEFMNQNL